MEHWTLEQYTKYSTNKKRLKFGNHPTAGYASKKEARRASDLRILASAKVITDLKEQPSFPFKGLTYDSGRVVTYVADFEYMEDGKRVVEDVKSEATRTPVYKIKKALMRAYYGIEVVEV